MVKKSFVSCKSFQLLVVCVNPRWRRYALSLFRILLFYRLSLLPSTILPFSTDRILSPCVSLLRREEGNQSILSFFFVKSISQMHDIWCCWSSRSAQSRLAPFITIIIIVRNSHQTYIINRPNEDIYIANLYDSFRGNYL